MSSPFSSPYSFAIHNIQKPLLTGVIAGVADKFILMETDMNRSAIFGASVSAGVFVATMLEPAFNSAFPPDSFTTTKSVSGRVFEIAMGGTTSYLINKYAALNDPYTELYKRLAIISAADFIAEGIMQYSKSF